MITGLFGLSTTGTIVLLIAILVIAYIVFRVLQYLLKAVVVGVIFMALPFVLTLGGATVGTDIKTLLWFMIMGIVVFFAFRSVKFGYKVTRTVFKPLNKSFDKKEQKKDQ